MNSNYYNDGISTKQRIISSIVGSTITAVTMTPLDVVKIRLQAQLKPSSKPTLHIYRTGIMDFLCECNYCKLPGQTSLSKLKFNGLIDATIKIVRTEGLKALWSGLLPTLLISLPSTIIYFPLYDYVKYWFGYDPSNHSTYYIPALAGCACRVVTVTIFSPLELLRTKMQAENISLQELKSIVTVSFGTRGPRFLMRGFVPALFRDVPFSGIYWIMYEYLKQKLEHEKYNKFGSFGNYFISGAVSGSVAALVTLPFDVIKTHRQIELGTALQDKTLVTPSLARSIFYLYKARGFSALFAGAVPRLIKIAPACAIMVSCYELGKIFFKNYNEKENDRRI